VNRLIGDLLQKRKAVVADVFGSAYAIQQLPALQNCNALLASYENLPYLQDISAQIIFGGVAASGKLPVSVAGLPVGFGLTTPKPTRLTYTLPEAVNFNRSALLSIDGIMKNAIAEKAFPGGQLFAAKDGKVFLMKSYGYFTYEPKHKVYNDDLYDIASVTKIMATTPMVMRYVEQQKLNLDTTLSAYLPDLIGSNKANIVLRDMLAHQSGLEAWIPFWMKTVDRNGERKKTIYGSVYSDTFSVYVASGIFMRYSYLDSMYRQVIASPVTGVGTYRYSDLCFYFLKRIIEKQEQQLLTDVVANNFYKPLGLPYMNYQPALRLPAWRCAPTENDKKFRTQQLQGSVHDQCAAMQGGIGGHAGVFSTANDVGVMMQLYLNGGIYGGIRYFDSATVNLFTRSQFRGNRRGLGFDKPEPDPQKSSPVCDGISNKSFGHQGFTGTLAWADPETGVVFVFLSNRVYPDADENKLAKMGIRNQVLKVILSEFQR
jgi:CubicO group peptidase (beta-lactamase class C family)